jgi:hypothetical protein
VYGERAVNVATALSARGDIRAQRGDTATALGLLRESVDITRAVRPAGDANLRYRMARLGDMQCASGQIADGESIVRTALAASPKPGSDTASVHVRSALAACLVRARRYAEAEPLLLEAETATRAKVDVLRRTIVSRLTWLYEQWGRSDDAAKWRAQMSSKTSVIPRGSDHARTLVQ